MRYPAALDIVRALVRPEREGNRDKGFRAKWWQFGRPRGQMRAALTSLARYVAAGRLAKRLNLTWQSAPVCPSDLIYVFAFDDDYSMGVLLSRAHGAWAQARDSTFRPTSGTRRRVGSLPSRGRRRPQCPSGRASLRHRLR